MRILLPDRLRLFRRKTHRRYLTGFPMLLRQFRRKCSIGGSLLKRRNIPVGCTFYLIFIAFKFHIYLLFLSYCKYLVYLLQEGVQEVTVLLKSLLPYYFFRPFCDVSISMMAKGIYSSLFFAVRYVIRQVHFLLPRYYLLR